MGFRMGNYDILNMKIVAEINGNMEMNGNKIVAENVGLWFIGPSGTAGELSLDRSKEILFAGGQMDVPSSQAPGLKNYIMITQFHAASLFLFYNLYLASCIFFIFSIGLGGGEVNVAGYLALFLTIGVLGLMAFSVRYRRFFCK